MSARRVVASRIAGCALGIAVASAHAGCKVAIDIGHSRAQPGATSARGVGEWAFNRRLAQDVLDALSAAGVDALLLDPGGEAMDLHERPLAASRAAATLLVSIHHDSVQPRYLSRWTWQAREQAFSDAFSGYGLFVSGRNPRDAESRSVAAAIGAALRIGGLTPSLHHAERIEGEGRELIDARLGIYRYDQLVVLAQAPMAAVLVEAGVIVNRDEELAVATPRYRQRVAQAVVTAAAAHCARQAAAPERPASALKTHTSRAGR